MADERPRLRLSQEAFEQEVAEEISKDLRRTGGERVRPQGGDAPRSGEREES